MKRLAPLLIALVATGAQAQTTNCLHIGNTLSCTTTPAPQPSPELQQGYNNLAAGIIALGIAARERREAVEEAREESRAAAANEAAAAAAQKQDYYNQVAAFAMDPAHPYFGLVRATMSDLIRAGTASTIQQAYDMAIAHDPAVQAVESERAAEAQHATVPAPPPQ